MEGKYEIDIWFQMLTYTSTWLSLYQQLYTYLNNRSLKHDVMLTFCFPKSKSLVVPFSYVYLDTFREILNVYCKQEISSIRRQEKIFLNNKFYTFEDLTTNHSRSATMQCVQFDRWKEIEIFHHESSSTRSFPLCLLCDDVVIGDGVRIATSNF